MWLPAGESWCQPRAVSAGDTLRTSRTGTRSPWAAVCGGRRTYSRVRVPPWRPRVGAATARTKPPTTLPAAAVAATGRVMGVLGRVVPVPPDYAAESMRAGLATYYGSPEKAIRELGWTCRELHDGLTDTVRALR